MNWGKFLFSFEGRISRKAFWLFVVAMIVISILLSLAIGQPQIPPGSENDPAAVMKAISDVYPAWWWPVQLFILYIEFAVCAKRWHDQERSGWWNLLLFPGSLLCGIGALVQLIMCGFIAGTPGPNKYGAGPMA